MKRIALLLSPIALFFGFLEFSIYSTFIVKDPIFIVKDFSHSFKTFLFYYIFALTLFLIIFIVFLLATPRYFKIIEKNNSKEENRLSQIFKKFIKRPYFSFIYIIVISKLIFYTVQVGFSIFPIIGYNMPTWFNILSSVLFILPLHFLIKDLLQRIIIARGKDKIKAIFSFIIYTFSSIVIIYASILIIIPFQLLKLGYFEANLVLEREYVNKPEFQDYLKMCHQNTQNNGYYIPSFIFLRTSSEYIVGCSKDSNVRIHIPADKVIAIEYIEEDSKKEENKNAPAPQ